MAKKELANNIPVISPGDYVFCTAQGAVRLCRVVGDGKNNEGLQILKTCHEVVPLSIIRDGRNWLALVRYNEKGEIKDFDLICIRDGQVSIFEEDTANSVCFSPTCFLKAYTYTSEKVFFLFEIKAKNLQVLSCGNGFECLHEATRKTPALYAMNKTSVSAENPQDLIKVFQSGVVQVLYNVYNIKNTGTNIMAEARVLRCVSLYLWKNEQGNGKCPIYLSAEGNLPGLVYLGSKVDDVGGVSIYERGYPKTLTFLYARTHNYVQVDCLAYQVCHEAFSDHNLDFTAGGYYPDVVKIQERTGCFYISLLISKGKVEIIKDKEKSKIFSLMRVVARLISQLELVSPYPTLKELRAGKELVFSPASASEDQRRLVVSYSDSEKKVNFTVCFADGEVAYPLGVQVIPDGNNGYLVRLFYEGGNEIKKW